ncbi:decaprenyl-diphosphate synthase subunit 1-like [Centruroides sculpturatus]|uniref:decaprenyl-diphosphate synthase subunit 1-like n=1 Tax=Centruroides sculpturatus TaxID=218467 RepID=UPI000C6E1394|nr:decaprenyl-diphosphate synthase subunit 1-like [Centruroides sculpturatus]
MRIGDGLCRYGFLQKLHHLRRNFLSILNYRLSSNLYIVKKYSFQQICAFKSTCGRSASFCLTNARNLYCFQKYCQTFAAHIPGHVPSTSATDLFKFVQLDILKIYEDIRKELETSTKELKEVTTYYFDGSGKAFRPLIAVIMAKALNYHVLNSNSLLDSQMKVAMTSEMIHIASLLHDDVIDVSGIRRGKPSANTVWGQRKAIFAADFILSQAAKILAKIGNTDVIILLSQVLVDLVQGELMQLGSREKDDQRFSHYLLKTFNKTASLISFTCQSIKFLLQILLIILIDDLLDFASSQVQMGKPTTVDLQLGLATAPVLFACEKYPEMNNLIMRRFSEPGDVEKAYKMVINSDGIENTRLLARKHCDEAVKSISSLEDTPEKKALIALTQFVLTRTH